MAAIPQEPPAAVEQRYRAASAQVWFTDSPANKIGSMSSNGTVVEYPIPTANSSPAGCAFGPTDGLLYFVEQNSFRVGAFDPVTTKFSEWPVPAPNSGLAGVAFDERNVLNIMVTADSAIQRMQANGNFLSPIQLPPGRYPHGPIACAGKIWFAEYKANRVAGLTPDGSVSETLLPQPDSEPFAMACAADGIYFTEYRANNVGRIDVNTSAVTQWKIPSARAHAMGVTAGYDGSIYFAESTRDKLAKLLLGGGAVAEYKVPTRGALPNKVTPCFLSAICFSERGAAQVGMLQLKTDVRLVRLRGGP